MAAEQRESVVFIDLDHTLLEGPFDTLVFPRVLGELAQKTGLKFEALLSEARAVNRARQADPACPAVRSMDWDDIFSELAARYGVCLETSALELVRSSPGPPFSHLLPCAKETLTRLAAARPRRALVLATKGLLRYQGPVLEALGLTPFFDDILAPDTTQALKKSPAFYGPWPARTRLQIMVGDTYEDDVEPPRRFGFRTVWKTGRPDGPAAEMDPFTRAGQVSNGSGQPLPPPDAVIYSLDELPEVIDRLEHETLNP